MDVPMKERDAAKLRPWAGQFPYVNGGLFGSNGTKDARSTVPKFTQIARSYLLHIGSLDWTQINPDIFGSMIQAVADDEERGALGMHYTSVPNILKVLKPLFLDDLHGQLKEGSVLHLLTSSLHTRCFHIKHIVANRTVFDPLDNFFHHLQWNKKPFPWLARPMAGFAALLQDRRDVSAFSNLQISLIVLQTESLTGIHRRDIDTIRMPTA
jgi:hypothetical protein